MVRDHARGTKITPVSRRNEIAASLSITIGAAPVAATVTALHRELDARGIPVFATIDHAAGAGSVGLHLSDEVVVVFGNPAVGTRLMQADPRSGIDLPLRILIWDQDGSTNIAYEDPHRLADRFDLEPVDETLDVMAGLLRQLVAAITTPSEQTLTDHASRR
ncbi:DUF302 domain-containing protein [Leifsonia sp. L25]|uniref:DUF302 domain-containing protein n=1 Tax=Actinomycetes TaxID=1760 RepID=UPI003D696E3C